MALPGKPADRQERKHERVGEPPGGKEDDQRRCGEEGKRPGGAAAGTRHDERRRHCCQRVGQAGGEGAVLPEQEGKLRVEKERGLVHGGLREQGVGEECARPDGVDGFIFMQRGGVQQKQPDHRPQQPPKRCGTPPVSHACVVVSSMRFVPHHQSTPAAMKGTRQSNETSENPPGGVTRMVHS